MGCWTHSRPTHSTGKPCPRPTDSACTHRKTSSPNVFLQNANPYKYQITKFLYATSEFTLGDWIVAGQSAWLGYVAVSTEEGKSVLRRRFQDANFPAVPVGQVYGTTHNPKAHQGFFSVYAHKNPDSIYNKNIAREQETSITVVGHSLGASLATLNAADIVANNYHKPTGSTAGCLVTAFYNMFNALTDLRLLRIMNLPDPVPNLPPKLLGFFEVGNELQILVSSSYLKLFLNPHSLELYMHGVAGYNGIEPFKFVVQRDIALLNKEDDHLKEEYYVPPKWRSMRNKAMYQSDDGSWKLHDYLPPPPETVGLL
ncbi:unnamed protein product [Linum tenue]|uniref:Phospholipase A1 n=1 Tax=Linum tenue TaxID=586396 RepID=A0AAV0N550_9ROSI|nr:unnamed protein product [Linum tenue]